MFYDIGNEEGTASLRVNLDRIEMLGQEQRTFKDEKTDEEKEYTRYFIGMSGNLINIDEDSYNELIAITGRLYYNAT